MSVHQNAAVLFESSRVFSCELSGQESDRDGLPAYITTSTLVSMAMLTNRAGFFIGVF